MGPGEDATQADLDTAYRLGKEIARKGWILLTGGRDAGVMDAASRGAFEERGITVGILPGHSREGASPYLTVPVVTGMREARNVVNVLTSDIIIGVGMNPGTASEIALAIKFKKPIFLLNSSIEEKTFFRQLSRETIVLPSSIEETLEGINQVLQRIELINS